MNTYRCARCRLIILSMLFAAISTPVAAWAATVYNAHNLYIIAPCRLYDSRLKDSIPKGPLTSNVVYSIDLPDGQCGIPPDAQALVLDVTVITTDPPAGTARRTGYISVFAGGTAPPGFGVPFREGIFRSLFLFSNRTTGAGPDLGLQGVSTIPTYHVALDVMGYATGGASTDIGLDSSSIQENQPAGSLVGHLSTTDPDSDEVNTYSLVSGTGSTDNASFQISGHQLQTSTAFDYEAQSTYHIRVRSTEINGGFIEKAFTIAVTNQNEAPTDVSLDSASIEENLPIGSLVGTLSATDVDAGDSQTYSLVTSPLGPDSGSFQISGNQLLTNTLLDQEIKASYTIVVQVADAGGLTFQKQLTIAVQNTNDPPVVSGGPFSLPENSSAGTTVGTVSATDQDAGQTRTFAITAGNTNGAFAIDPSTGVITVATPSAIDYETQPVFQLTVQATDNGSPARSGWATVTVQLTDVDEPPAPAVVGGGPLSIPENSSAGTVVGSVAANDPDSGGTYTYAITGGNANGAFAINPATGEITVVNPAALDYETTPTIILTIVVTDSTGMSGTVIVTIHLTDVNEAPVPSGGPFSLAENSANGTTVGTVDVANKDANQTHTVTITAGNTGGAFAIHPTTGVITVASSGALNFEANPTFSLTVSVTDSGSPPLSGSTTVVIHLTDVNEAPTPSGGPFTRAENSSPGTVIGTVLANDPDSGQASTFAITSGNTGGAFTINSTTGQITVANAAALDYETNPTFTLTVQVTDNGTPSQSGSATVVVNLTNANDPPVPSGAVFSISENSINGTTLGSISFTDQDAGQSHTFAITAGNTGGAFSINASTGALRVANSPSVNFEATPAFTLTVRVTDNGSPSLSGTATVTINVLNVAEAPVANDEGSLGSPYVETVGNTILEVTATPSLPYPKISFNGNLLTNDFDPDGPTSFTLTLESSSPGATIMLNNDGTFTYMPPAGFMGVDTFTYRVTDSTSLFDTATVYINVEGRVWYVKNDTAAGGLGRSTDPFDLLAKAEAASATGDTIYLFAGNGTTLGQSDGIVLKSGQRLIGEAAPLIVPSVNINGVVGPTLQPAGSRPKIENDNTPDAVGEDNGVNVAAVSGNATNVEIRGLDIAGYDNAIDLTVTGSKTASLTIRDNVIRGAGLEGIDVNDSSTGQVDLSIYDNTLTATGNAIDILKTAGSVYIKAFEDNVVTGSTDGTGININGAVFDAVPGGPFETVSGGATAIGALGDGVGQAGLVLTDVEGDLSFSSLNIFADGGAGLSASSFTEYTGSSGLRITAAGGTGLIEAAGGPAVDMGTVDLHLDLASLESANSPSTGVSLTGITGSFATGSASSILNPAGAAFLVNGSNAAISYPGTISANSGSGVSLTNNTGSTISFSGTLTLSTGSNPAFSATGGGTVTATDAGSTLTTTTATALNVVSTTIGAGGLRFRSISSNGGASSGIVLDTTGTLGGLTVSGAGGTCTGVATCSGGAIQNKTGDAISLSNARNVSLSNLFLDNVAGDGIDLSVSGTTGIQLTVAGGMLQNIGGTALLADGVGDTQRTVTVTGTTFRDSGRGVRLLGSDNADLTFELTGNTFLRHVFEPIQVATDSSSTNAMQVVGKVNANTIGDGSPDSGSASSYGIAADLAGDADSILSLTGNSVSHSELAGIYVQARLDNDADAETGRLDLTLRDNAVQAPDGTSYGTRVESRNTTRVCLDIAGNSSASSAGLEHFQTRQLDTSTFLMERLSDKDGTPGELVTDMPTVETFLAGQNDAGSTADATQATLATGYTEADDGACRKP